MHRVSHRLVLAGLFLFIVLGSDSFAQAERSPLGLQGCKLSGLHGNSDGSLVFAGCEFSAKSIFVSKDFGQTWAFAGGGAFEGGDNRGMVMGSGYLYASLNRKFVRTSVPTSAAPIGWTAAWVAITTPEQGTSAVFRASDDIVYASSGQKIFATNAATGAVNTTAIIAPGGGNFRQVRAYAGMLYAQVSDATTGVFGPAKTALYRAPYDPATGLPTGDWTNLMGNFPGVTATDADTWSFHIHPDTGDLYVDLRTYPGGGAPSDRIYTSSDDGASFVATTHGFSVNHMCFDGSTIIFDSRISTDSAASFTDITLTSAFESIRPENGGCYIVPSDSNRAMIGTNVGVAVSTTANTPGAWTPYSSGMEGVKVMRLSQSPTNKDRAILSSWSGLAYSSNFTSATPTWIFPICPGGDCQGQDSVVFDPNDTSRVFYGSGNIRKGTVAEDGLSVTWSDWANLPQVFLRAGSFDIYNYEGIKNRLYVAYNRYEGELNGGIYYYDVTQPAGQTPVAVTDPDVAGKPIASMIAISSQVMFANRGGTQSPESFALTAVLQSRDGGSSWDAMPLGELPAQPYITAWAYDSTRDILFAGISSQASPPGHTGPGGEGVYALSGAAAGAGSWVKLTGQFNDQGGQRATPFNLTEVTVDKETGRIYVAAGQWIWFSDDLGATFTLAYAGRSGEVTEDLEVDADPAATPAGFASVKTRRARLAQGADSGLYAFDINQLPNTATPPEVTPTTPAGPPATCKLSVDRACLKKSGISKSAACVFSIQVLNGKKAYPKAKVQMEKALQKGGTFSATGKVITVDKKGKKTTRVKPGKTSYLRLVGKNVSCTSKTITIKVKAKGK